MADRLRPGGAGPPRDPTDAQLERALRDLGREIAFPPAPDLARSVRVRLAARPVTADRAPGWLEAVAAWFAALTPRRAIAVAALAILLAGAALLALVPTARDTVAGWFGVRGIRIVWVDETPTPAQTPPPAAATAAATPTNLGSNLLLGERVTLAEVQAGIDFPILVPDPDRLGPPDEVYLRQRSDGAIVSLIYYPRPGLPAAAETGVGLLFVQFEAPEDEFWLEKGAAPANEVRVIKVGGEDALWLGGTHYLWIAPDPSLYGGSGPRPTRLAGNVLLWDEDGVTYRLESALPSSAATRLAEDLVPPATPTP